jgi:hypothetical protein
MNTLCLWTVTALYGVQAGVALNAGNPASALIMAGYVLANLGLIWSMRVLI